MGKSVSGGFDKSLPQYQHLPPLSITVLGFDNAPQLGQTILLSMKTPFFCC
jgi:hypothetical protein